MINHDQVLDFGVPKKFGPIQFLFKKHVNLNEIYDLPALPLSWSFHPWWQLAGPASSSFLEEMGLVIHQLGISARGPSFSKVTLFVGITGSHWIPTVAANTNSRNHGWCDWVAFTFWEVSLVYFTNSFARHHPFLVIGYHVPQPKTKQVSR